VAAAVPALPVDVPIRALAPAPVVPLLEAVLLAPVPVPFAVSIYVVPFASPLIMGLLLPVLPIFAVPVTTINAVATPQAWLALLLVVPEAVAASTAADARVPVAIVLAAVAASVLTATAVAIAVPAIAVVPALMLPTADAGSSDHAVLNPHLVAAVPPVVVVILLPSPAAALQPAVAALARRRREGEEATAFATRGVVCHAAFANALRMLRRQHELVPFPACPHATGAAAPRLLGGPREVLEVEGARDTAGDAPPRLG